MGKFRTFELSVGVTWRNPQIGKEELRAVELSPCLTRRNPPLWKAKLRAFKLPLGITRWNSQIWLGLMMLSDVKKEDMYVNSRHLNILTANKEVEIISPLLFTSDKATLVNLCTKAFCRNLNSEEFGKIFPFEVIPELLLCIVVIVCQ